MPDAVLSRRDRERLTRRRAMLDAALAVFGAHGFEGATVDEIAERAEFGKGTLYNYFPGGKDELYLTLFEERVVGGMADVIEAAFADPSELDTPVGARAAFHRLIAGLLAHFEGHRGLTMLFMRDGHRLTTDPGVRQTLAGRFEALMDAVTQPVARAITSGALRDLPPHAIAHMILGSVRGYLMARYAEGLDCDAPPPLDPAAAADFLTTVLFDGLLADRA